MYILPTKTGDCFYHNLTQQVYKVAGFYPQDNPVCNILGDALLYSDNVKILTSTNEWFEINDQNIEFVRNVYVLSYNDQVGFPRSRYYKSLYHVVKWLHDKCNEPRMWTINTPNTLLISGMEYMKLRDWFTITNLVMHDGDTFVCGWDDRSWVFPEISYWFLDLMVRYEGWKLELIDTKISPNGKELKTYKINKTNE